MFVVTVDTLGIEDGGSEVDGAEPGTGKPDDPKVPRSQATCSEENNSFGSLVALI